MGIENYDNFKSDPTVLDTQYVAVPTFKDLSLAKILELDESKAPFCLQDKYTVEKLLDPVDTLEL
jgi:hypothetical protein